MPRLTIHINIHYQNSKLNVCQVQSNQLTFSVQNTITCRLINFMLIWKPPKPSNFNQKQRVSPVTAFSMTNWSINFAFVNICSTKMLPLHTSNKRSTSNCSHQSFGKLAWVHQKTKNFLERQFICQRQSETLAGYCANSSRFCNKQN